MEQELPLGILIKFIHNAIKSDYDHLLKDMELTSTQTEVLMYLLFNQDTQITQKDIENKFKITNPTVTGIVKRLENKGFIQRIVSPNDSRYKQIIITDKIINMKKSIVEKRQLIEGILTTGFTLEEEEQLRFFLTRMLNNLTK